MTSMIVTQTTFNLAYKLGVEDAKAGNAFAPEAYFTHPEDKHDYALGFESIKGVSVITAAFTGSEVAPVAVAPIVTPNYKRNGGREFTRRTDNQADAIFKADAARERRIDAMLEATADFMGGIFAGDILWAVS